MSAIDSRKSREIVPASDGDRLALNAFFPRWLAQGTGYSAWLVVDRSAEPEVVGAAILQNTLDGEGEEAGLFMDIAAIDESIFLDVVEGLLKEVLDAARSWGAPAVKVSSSAIGAHAADILLKRRFVVTDTFDTYEVDLEPAMRHLQKVISRLKGKSALKGKLDDSPRTLTACRGDQSVLERLDRCIFRAKVPATAGSARS